MDIDIRTSGASFALNLDQRRRPTLPVDLMEEAGIPLSIVGLLAYSDRKGRIVLEDPMAALDALSEQVLQEMAESGFTGSLEDDLYAERAADASLDS